MLPLELTHKTALRRENCILLGFEGMLCGAIATLLENPDWSTPYAMHTRASQSRP